ncbi:MAG: hypothetical protein CVT67_02975 [Actinobacteria bacterium HGW-Actinobacteria-7]|jgi:hypothetical protein|nr:MAG: hypothetical protein CVT67_02975 [Actinobacteria bacterium HGW-Actinobacteria-7]
MSGSTYKQQHSTTSRQDLSAAKSTAELLRDISDEDPTVRALVTALNDGEYRDRMPNNRTLRVTAQKIVDTAAELKKFGLAVQVKNYQPYPNAAYKRLYLRTTEDIARDEAAENITLKEAAKMVGTSVQGLLAQYINTRRWDCPDGIKGEKTDKGWRVSRSSVEAYLKRNTPTDGDAEQDNLADGCIDFVEYQYLDGRIYTPMSHRTCRDLCDALLVSAQEHHASPDEPVLAKLEWDFRQVEQDYDRWERGVYRTASQAILPDDASFEEHDAARGQISAAYKAARDADPYYKEYLAKSAVLKAAINAKNGRD